MNAGTMPETSIQNTTATSAADPDAWRQTLRRQSIAQRLALPAARCAEFSRAICAHLQQSFPQLASQRIGFCWPVKNEPDLRPLMEVWQRAASPGFTALLPVVVDTGTALAFRAWSPEAQLVADRYGIPTPATGEFLLPQVLLLPVNAVDARGYRLGYGGGFFDRTLAALTPKPLAIGVGYELARVESIQPEAHDMRLDALVTEAGVIRFS